MACLPDNCLERNCLGKNMIKKIMVFFILFFSMTVYGHPLHIVAAENFYGDIAKFISGPYGDVLSIMNNPNQDPHLFSINIKTAKAISDADLIIYNGINYDPWMERLIADKLHKNIIIVADLVDKKSGDNPHIWYDPFIILTYAKELTSQLVLIDPSHEDYYKTHLKQFEQQYEVLMIKIAQLKNNYKNTSIIATEPVFNNMAERLGFNMAGKSFQLSIMNDTAPSAKDIKDFENKLRQHEVRALIYNKQVINPIAERMQRIAKQSNIPVIGITETMPLNENYFSWMNKQLDELERELK
jgi:zinc/manganese transport system substrate-binding protein